MERKVEKLDEQQICSVERELQNRTEGNRLQAMGQPHKQTTRESV